MLSPFLQGIVIGALLALLGVWMGMILVGRYR
jgi:hypothetical protein